jgi:hypothetical protein
MPSAPFSLGNLLVPTCALVAVGIFYAAVRLTPGSAKMRQNRTRKRARSGNLNPNRKRSLAARGILVLPKEGL